MQKQKIKIAFFLPSLEPGGAERNVANLVNNINREKYAVSLVLGKAEGDFIKEINKNIPIASLNSSFSSGLFFKLVEYFKKEKPDIFISAFSRFNIISIAARNFSKSKTKIIATEHAVFTSLPLIAKNFWRRIFARFFLPLLGKLIYPKAEAIVCVSRGIAQDISKAVYCKAKVIYNPVADDKILQKAQEPAGHPWFDNKKIPVIIAVGRLVECKDYSVLLKAFSLVLKKKESRLIILGRGPEEKNLKQLSEDLGLSGKASFLGFQENPYKYMRNSSVFVLSSVEEGFGNVIVEAMACGTPVVSTDCPTGPGEIIENMKNGILVPIGDENAIAGAILKILNNPDLSEKLSIEGRARAGQFSIRESVEKYEEIFQELINK